MKNSIKNNRDFQKIITKKKFINNEFFKIYFQPNIEFQFGIAIGKKKFPLAVDRNKIKRWIREIVIHSEIINSNYKIIIVVNLNTNNIQFRLFEEKLINLLKKLKG